MRWTQLGLQNKQKVLKDHLKYITGIYSCMSINIEQLKTNYKTERERERERESRLYMKVIVSKTYLSRQDFLHNHMWLADI